MKKPAIAGFFSFVLLLFYLFFVSNLFFLFLFCFVLMRFDLGEMRWLHHKLLFVICVNSKTITLDCFLYISVLYGYNFVLYGFLFSFLSLFFCFFDHDFSCSLIIGSGFKNSLLLRFYKLSNVLTGFYKLAWVFTLWLLYWWCCI